MSGPTWSAWPAYLEGVLHAKFGDRIAVHHRAHPDLRATVMQEAVRLDSIMAYQPDAVIVECAFDDQAMCDSTHMCVEAAWAAIVDGIRSRRASTEVFWYIVNPFCTARGLDALSWNSYLAYEFEPQRRLCAAESLYLVDTWTPILDSLSAMPGYTACGDCGRLANWFPDSHHPSGFVATQVIVPLFLSAMSGDPIDETPPAAAPDSLTARLLTSAHLDLSFSGVPVGSDPESGVLGYNIWCQLAPGCTTYYSGQYARLTTVTSASRLWQDSSYACAVNYWVAAANGFGREGPRSEVVTPVVPDSIAPQVLRVTPRPTGDTLIVEFSESVDSASAVDSTNYTAAGGYDVVSRALSADGRSVSLLVRGLTACTGYTVTVDSVRDRSPLHNMLARTTRGFYFSGRELPLCLSAPAAGCVLAVGDTLALAWECDTHRTSLLTFHVSLDGGNAFFDMFGQSLSASAGKAAWPIPPAVQGISTISRDVVIAVHEYGVPQAEVLSPQFRITTRDSVDLTPGVSEAPGGTGCGSCGSGASQALLVPLGILLRRGFLRVRKRGKQSGERGRS
jgi:hypothetical protein